VACPLLLLLCDIQPIAVGWLAVALDSLATSSLHDPRTMQAGFTCCGPDPVHALGSNHALDRKRGDGVQQLAELVGKNLYQLSSLNGLNFAQYKELVLPCISEQIVQCEDKLAQQYLMEVCWQPHTSMPAVHTFCLIGSLVQEAVT
jgi:hypothetical protein